MDYAALVMFAIQAAIRLGRKIQQIFEDETRDVALVLPNVEGRDLPGADETLAFFEGPGAAMVGPSGLA
jgi:hypothetical protein